MDIYPFDGRPYGILNFNDSIFVTVELFQELLHLKLNAGLPTNAYWQSKVETLLLDSYRNTALSETRKYWMNMSGKVIAFEAYFIDQSNACSLFRSNLLPRGKFLLL